MKLEDLSNSEIANLIDDYVRGNKAHRNRNMLKDRLITGMRYEKLAEKYGLSVRQTQRIIYKASDQLFRHI